MKTYHQDRKGMALITALLLLVALSAIALGLMLSTTLENTIASNDRLSEVAFQNSEAGIEMARNILLDYRWRDQGFTKFLAWAQDYDNDSTTDPQLRLEDVGFDATTGDPKYSAGANVYSIPTDRYQLTIWDDSNVPVEDNDPKNDTNFAVMVQSVGFGPAGVATRTITTRLQYGTDKDYAQHEQNSYSNSSANQNVDATSGNSSTNTFTPAPGG